ncbi:MAG: excinuclease ABC subunit C [Prevotellaceae bacterium]|nr:excinuclease ABC subunit C [Prevotellaceae bacterium]
MNKEERKRLDLRLKNIINNMPEGPGSYQYYDERGNIIYVGKAKNLKRRVSSYFVKEQNRKTQLLVDKIRDIKYINVATEQDALLLENSLIKRFQPHYNILLKDDKSYPYICLTKEDYPRIFSTRNKTARGAEYFGPYSHTATMYNLLELIRNLYKIRNCRAVMTEEGVRQGKYKLCLSYHIKKCMGCCVGRQTKEEYQQNIAECRLLLKGHTREVKEKLREKMMMLAEQQRFEEAQELKVRYDLLNQFQAKSEVVSNTIGNLDVFNILSDERRAIVNYLHIVDGATTIAYTFEINKKMEETDEELLRYAIVEMGQKFGVAFREIVLPFEIDIPLDEISVTVPQKGDKKTLLDLSMRNVQQYKVDKLKRAEYLNPEQRQTRLMTELRDALHLRKLPVTIELFDNSNLQGQDAVAGCVVYKKMRPSKQDYRKYVIKTVDGPDDYASMQEVVRRRYSRFIEENTPLPDLIITDGGRGQMECVRKVVEDELHLQIPIAGLAKDNRHRTNELLFGFPPIVIGLKQNSELFKVLTAMQDEVHRYAISFHKAKRAKRQTRSELDDIAGVGKTTKDLLIKTFKSVKRVKEADLFELQSLLGMKKGSLVWQGLHKTPQNTDNKD